MSMRHIVRGATSAISFTCLLLSTPAGAGQLTLYRLVNYDLNLDRENVYTENSADCDTCMVLQAGFDTATGPYVAAYEFPGYEPWTTSHTAASAGTVGYGFIRGLVSASIATDQPGGFSGSESNFQASFTDTMTVQPVDPALLGQFGTLTGSLQLDYLRSTSAQGSPLDPSELLGASVEWGAGISSLGNSIGGGGSASFRESVTDGASPYSQYFISLTGANGSPAPDSLMIPFVLGFVFGEAFDVTVELAATAFATFEGGVLEGEQYQASATLNLLNTLTWQGVSSVLDAEGNPVAFSLASASGTDWTVPATVIPLPPAVWLFGTALAGLALRRRQP
jgi:hypothetical protein